MARVRLFGLWVVLGLVSDAASAETAYTTRTVNLRAGPAREYPLILQLEPDMPVEVVGCLDDWTWCDVIVGLDRGWVYAGHLDYPYEGRRVAIVTGGAYIGLPIVAFSVGPYWDTYYRGRPWYGRRYYWVHRAPPLHRGPVVRPASPGPARPLVARPPGARSVAPPPARPARPEVARPQATPPRPVVVRPDANRPRPPRPGAVKREEKKQPPPH